MNTILALDASGAACSVALLRDDNVEECFELAPRDHTRLILPMVDQLLGRCGLSLPQLDAIAFGCGPGSFTGLRICVGVVQGLAFGANLPVVAVSSLAAVAQGLFRQNAEAGRALVCMDARMGELYFADYVRDGSGVMLQGRECLLAPGELAWERTDQPLYGLGSGWAYLDEMPAFQAQDFAALDTGVLPRARYIAELGLALFQRGEVRQAWQAEPTYLREQVAWKKVDGQ